MLIPSRLRAACLGHSSIKTTLDIYGHLFEPLDQEAVDRLEELVISAMAHGTRIRRLTRIPPNAGNPCVARVSARWR